MGGSDFVTSPFENHRLDHDKTTIRPSTIWINLPQINLYAYSRKILFKK
jgi:hypothetical protein